MILQVLYACAVAGVTAISLPPQEPAQSAPASEVRATVTIGDTAAPAEWELNVPVALKVADGAEVGRLALQLVYPAKTLRYVGIKGTEKLKAGGFSVAATASPDKGPEKSDQKAPEKGAEKAKDENGVLTIQVQPAKTAPKPLQNGTIIIVTFKVAVDAEEKTWPMKAENVLAWGVGPEAAELKAAASGPAKFIVTPAGLPILGCFFYMH